MPFSNGDGFKIVVHVVKYGIPIGHESKHVVIRKNVGDNLDGFPGRLWSHHNTSSEQIAMNSFGASDSALSGCGVC